jgi:4-alpha-glucanotransferase
VKNSRVKIDRWGVASRYQDAFGQWREVSDASRSAIHHAIDRREPGEVNTAAASIKVLKPGEGFRINEPAELTLEDGSRLKINEELPRGLPIGYHELKALSTHERTRIIVSPGHCYLPKSLRIWGWAVQLYALRSKQSWGMGDFKDLEKFNRWAARTLNSDFILTNPLAASTPVLPQQASPYYPGSRRFLNPLYLCVEEIPAMATVQNSIKKIAEAGRALNQDRLIDRDRVFELKMQALEIIWGGFKARAELDIFSRDQGEPLLRFATFCTLAEHFKSGWTQWPQLFQGFNSPAVRRFAREHGDRIRFHQWLQWLLHRQFKRATKALPVIQDLPVGVDPSGADAWSWQGLLAKDVSIGAPPDAYNRDGQNWGMQPFIPERLRAAGYEPFRQTLQAMLRFGGGLRIDHVMGLFRLFWIPKNMAGSDGAYVHYAADELLAVLAIESQRAKALVVGEDLGTVEQGVRQELQRRKILSYRLMWFESKPVRKFPRQALVAVTTHDLFTVAGVWNGSDIAARKKAGLHPHENDTLAVRKKLEKRLHLRPDAPVSEAVVATYRLLSKAPSMLLTASLDDALGVEERPNMPGTINEWPNWRLALPYSLETIRKSGEIKKIAAALARRRT